MSGRRTEPRLCITLHSRSSKEKSLRCRPFPVSSKTKQANTSKTLEETDDYYRKFLLPVYTRLIPCQVDTNCGYVILYIGTLKQQ